MSFIGKWWSLRQNNPLWKVFWLFWFVPSNILRIAIAVLMMRIFISSGHPHLFAVVAAKGWSGLIAVFFDLFGLYYIFKARLRTQYMLLGIVALAVCGLYISNDVMSMLSWVHFKPA